MTNPSALSLCPSLGQSSLDDAFIERIGTRRSGVITLVIVQEGWCFGITVDWRLSRPSKTSQSRSIPRDKLPRTSIDLTSYKTPLKLAPMSNARMSLVGLLYSEKPRNGMPVPSQLNSGNENCLWYGW